MVKLSTGPQAEDINFDELQHTVRAGCVACCVYNYITCKADCYSSYRE